MRHAIAFVLAAASDTSSTRGAAIERRRANDLAEVASALAVRRLYTNFRRGLRRPEQETAEAVLSALRYAARDINHRQELRAHDQALSLSLLAEPPGDTALWFDRLFALRGLDDSLDALLEQAKRNEPLPQLLPSAIERLRSLV